MPPWTAEALFALMIGFFLGGLAVFVSQESPVGGAAMIGVLITAAYLIKPPRD